jgi:hypothetical protein
VLLYLLESWQGGPSSATALDEDQLELAQRLAETPEEKRAPFLELVRSRLDKLPHELIHATWLAPILPDDPLLVTWILASVPSNVRQELLRLLPDQDLEGTVWTDATGPPRWFGNWWREFLRDKLPYPHPLPLALDPLEPLTYLWRMEDQDLETLLRFYGLRLVASGLHNLEHKEIVRIAYSFGPALRDRLVDHVKNRRIREEPVWQDLLKELEARHIKSDDIAIRMAILELGASASQHGRTADGVRLVYRLPVRLGRELLKALTEPHEGAAEGDEASLNQRLKEDLDELQELRLITEPELGEEGL